MAVICASSSCNVSKINNPEIHFFRFPEEDELCKIWITRSGRHDLLEKSCLEVHKAYSLCERHFEEDCFDTSYPMVTILKNNALPTIFDNYFGTQPIEMKQVELRSSSGTERLSIPHNVTEVTVIRFEPFDDPSNVTCTEYHSSEIVDVGTCYEMLTSAEAVSFGFSRKDDENDQRLILQRDLHSLPVSEISPLICEENEPIVLHELTTSDSKEDVTRPVSVCRICAETGLEYISLFGQRGQQLQLVQKIEWYLPIYVSESDLLPLEMCGSCIEKLNSCHELFNKCLLADSKLQELFSKHQKSKENMCEINLLKKNIEEDETVSSSIKEENDESNGSTKEVNNRKLCVARSKRAALTIQEKESASAKQEKLKSDENSNLTSSVDSKQKAEDGRGLRRTKRVSVKRSDPEFVTKLSDSEHEEEVVTEKEAQTWKCEFCDHVALRRTSLIIHERLKHSHLGIYSCNYCSKKLKTLTQKHSHELRHLRKTKGNWICESCGKSFKNIAQLKNHLATEHSENRPFQCDQCDRRYGSLTSLDIHKATHSSETPFLCDLCGKSFKHVSNLRSHKRSHLEAKQKNSQVCEICGKGYRSRFHLSEHMNIHLGTRPYTCEVCGKKFHKKIQLRQHGSTHLGMQPYKCPECGVRFNRRGNMTQHMKRHKLERKFTCKVCFESFETLGSMLAHRRQHSQEEVMESLLKQEENGETQGYPCEECGKLLAKKESYIIHKRSHSGIKLYECPSCGKKLSNKNSVIYHMRSFHTGERPYPCDNCGERFLSKVSLRAHIRIHTGEKPYECKSCGMAFRKSSNLSQHLRVHSTARPYPCPHCEKKFQRKGALDVHLRIHTGERPYSCDVCNRGFTQKNDMLKHQRTHLHERPFQCIECRLKFNHKKDLLNHQQLHEVAVEVPTQTVLITTSDNLITTLSDMNDQQPTLILQRF